MMKHKQKTAWFLSVILAAVLMNSLLSPALALFTKTIQVQSGFNFYVDDKKLTPKDSNGNPIEAFLYNGTTYLPVRAVSEALDIPIQWDGSTQSVYVGKHTGDKPAVWVGDLDYFTKSGGWNFSGTTKDNLGVEHAHSVVLTNDGSNSAFTNSGSVTYKLNGQYSYLTGLFYQLYDERSSNNETTLTIYADGESVWKASVTAGKDPVEINVNVQGVKELKIGVYNDGYWSFNYYAAIGELGLWA